MGQIRNDDVVDCWKRGFRGQNRNMTTDGNNLFSYSLKIGYTDDKGQKVALDYTAPTGNFYSRTTSKHVSLAKSVTKIIEEPT